MYASRAHLAVCSLSDRRSLRVRCACCQARDLRR
ncbi:MAG TPA: hypothetical protein DIT28_08760 [Oxalobacteraceae bacterium]|nr:hypothetical protein [Oxalobacteraceae bacterium]